MAFAKWVGGAIGWALGGPIGGLIGFAVGYMAEDKSLSTQEQQAGSQRRTYARHTQRGVSPLLSWYCLQQS
jgi:hypothetical protein